MAPATETRPPVPIETALLLALHVADPSEDEPIPCTLGHHKYPVYPMPDCTYVGVGRVRDSCGPRHAVVCQSGQDWIKTRMQNDDIRCPCLLPPSQCWSLHDL